MEDVEEAGKGVLTKDSQLINIIPEAVLSPNPVQALADKRELDYLNSVRKYQIDIAAREQNYLESVQQQQQAAVQREDAYAEMVLTAAIKLRQEADRRKAAYLQSVRAAQEQEQANNGLVDKELSIRVTLYDD